VARSNKTEPVAATRETVTMPLFLYKALQTDGTVTEGNLDAEGRQEAFRQIEGRGLTPISLSPARNGQTAKMPNQKRKPQRSPGLPRKISSRTLENFTRLLSSLLAAGVPLSRALVILHREASTPVARTKWKEIHDSVVTVRRWPIRWRDGRIRFRAFTWRWSRLARPVLPGPGPRAIADFQAREKELRSKVMTALLYPAILLTLALSVLVFLLVFFIQGFRPFLRFRRNHAAVDAHDRRYERCCAVVRPVRGALVWRLGGYFIRNWMRSRKEGRVWERFSSAPPSWENSSRSSPWHGSVECWGPCWPPVCR